MVIEVMRAATTAYLGVQFLTAGGKRTPIDSQAGAGARAGAVEGVTVM